MSNSRHVVVYSDDPDEGGVAVYTHALSCGLARLGYEVTCVQSETSNPRIDEQRQLGVRHQWLRFHTRRDLERSFTNLQDAEEALTAARPDLVLFANCDPFSHFAAKTVALGRGLPVVVVESFVSPDSEIEQTEPQAEWFMRSVADHYHRASAVVAVSQDNLDLLRSHYGLPAGKGEVIHYGRPDHYFAPRNLAARDRLRCACRVPREAVMCLTIGRLENVKGYPLLLSALCQWKDTPLWPKLFFAWLGSGSLESSLRSSLEEMGLADHVFMPGRRWDVPDWLDAADIYLLPSYCEGMPISIMEAMAKGLPVMATAVSGTPEELGATGKLLCSPNVNSAATITEMVVTLEHWAGSTEVRAGIGAACRNRASLLFREQRMIDQTRQVINRALLPPKSYVSAV
jgi:glycosyltransferase involved in cell wall biosynthesis